MSDIGGSKKRGRPAIYDSPQAKARADVERKRARRQSAARQRREHGFHQFYEGIVSPCVVKAEDSRAGDFVIENPGERVHTPRTPDRDEDQSSSTSADEYPLNGIEDDDFVKAVDSTTSPITIDPPTSPLPVRDDAIVPSLTDKGAIDDAIDPPATTGLSKRPSEPRLSSEQWEIVRLVLSGANVFYTGGAGTGKSTVLRAIVATLRRRRVSVEVVTPTGISALNVSGSTYFTWAGWHPGIMKKSIEEIEKLAMSTERRSRIRNTTVLIIDEISMLESNHFRRLDRACRVARGCPDDAFGGIRVVVTGDFYQLPPVKAFQTCFECGTELNQRVFCQSCESLTPEDIFQPSSQRSHKGCLRCGVVVNSCLQCPKPACGQTFDIEDQWAFRSDSWRECNFRSVSLTKVHRQNDSVFVDILNTLRIGSKLDDRQLGLLSDPPESIGDAIELSPVRREVDRKNLEGFKAIGGVIRQYRCHDHVHIQKHHPNLAFKAEEGADGTLLGCQDHRFPPLLEMKFGMPIILLSNIDPGSGLVNGSQGRVVGFSSHQPLLRERARRLAESGDFGRFEEDQIVLWVREQYGEGFPLPIVRFENGVQRAVHPVCLDTEVGDPAPFSVIARTQIPLLPAWAITIHKSQGMTLERAVVNFDQIFEPQMAYVALSRLRSLQGLKVLSRVSLGTLQDRGLLGRSSLTVRAFMNHLLEDSARSKS